MATTIFPQNDPNPADETDFQNLVFPGLNYVQRFRSGGGSIPFNISTVSGLDITLGSGQGVIFGTRIAVTSSVTLTAPDDATTILALKRTVSGGLVQSPASDEDNFTFHTTGQTWDDENYLGLFVVVASGGSITKIDDIRWETPGLRMAVRPGAGATESRTSTTTLEPSEMLRVPIPRAPGPSNEVMFGFSVQITTGLIDGGIKFQIPDPDTNIVGGNYHAKLIQYGSPAELIEVDTESDSSTVSVNPGTGSAQGWLEIVGYYNIVSEPGIAIFEWAQASSDSSPTNLNRNQMHAWCEILPSGRDDQ